MASKRREVGKLHKEMSGYLEMLGVSKEMRLQFEERANFMEEHGFYLSSWFDSATARLSQILHQIQQPPRPEIDLNEPAPPQHNRVEDEASSNGRGKRKRVRSPLRIRESNNFRPSHQVPPIQLSDDSD